MTCLRHAIVATAATLAAAPSAVAAVPNDFAGIDAVVTYTKAQNAQFADFNSDLAKQRKSGIRIHRQVFNWSQIESTRGTYNFGTIDIYMTGLATHGQTVLPILFDAPSFYQAKSGATGVTAAPNSGKALGKFGAAVIKRYGPKGSFWKTAGMGKYRKASAIHAVQIWNEPNLRYYWGNRPNAKAYGKVLRDAAAQIKKANKSVEIVTAGIPFSKTARAINPVKFIAGMYKVKGVRKAVETLGFNAYANNTRDLEKKLKTIRKALKKAHDGKAKIWITEIGWADKGKDSSSADLVKGAKGQAREITKAIAFMGKNRRKLGLRGFVYFQWQDTPAYGDLSPKLWGFHAGLLTKSGKSKPAHKAFTKAVKKL